MSQKGAHLVWSPASNLILYNKTTDIKSAKKSKLNIINRFSQVPVSSIFVNNEGHIDTNVKNLVNDFCSEKFCSAEVQKTALQ